MLSAKLMIRRHQWTLIVCCILLPLVSTAVELYKCPGTKYDLPKEIHIPTNLTHKTIGNQSLVFRVKEKRPNCKRMISETFSILETKPLISFFEDGVLLVRSEYFDPDEYCLSRLDDSTVDISHCQVKCGQTHTCVRKCCGIQKVLNYSQPGCVVPLGSTRWKPTIYSKTGNGKKVTGLRPHISYLPCSNQAVPYTYKTIKFSESFIGENSENETEYVELEGTPFQLLEDGTIVLNPKQGNGQGHSRFKDFCIDGMLAYEEGQLIPNPFFSGSEDDQFVNVCGDGVEEVEVASKTVIMLICFLILGILFLIMTVIVYLLIWEKHNIHGWAIFAFVISMLVFFVALLVAHISSSFLLDASDTGSAKCIVIAIFCHFSFICTTCWMSVINFDLWATFRSLAPSKGKTKSIQRFCSYALFAIGVPSVIVLISVVLDFSYKNTPEDELTLILPKYGQGYCRIHPSAESFYLYIPIGILLAFNVLMFSSTVFTLWRYKKASQTAANSSSNSAAGSQKQSLLLFCKLFVVMGITWVMELISWLCSSNVQINNNWSFWDLFDIINLLQAVAIFFIFAAKRENLLWIYRKYPKSKKIIGPILRLKPCHVGRMDLEQTEMTSADIRNKIDRNTRVSFKSRISSSSETAYD